MNAKLRRHVLFVILTSCLCALCLAPHAAAQSVVRRVGRKAKRVATAPRLIGGAVAGAVMPSAEEFDAAADPPVPDVSYASAYTDLEIARRFAPVFYQGLGSSPRYDYITNFDFDGDWRGDNNWQNAARRRFPLKAYVYYAVAETPTHYFVTYAVFHPRDYKGGKLRGRVLSNAIERGVGALGRFDPTGRAAEAVLAHENDLEGALVVAEKRGAELRSARVQFVETLAHNRFLKYAPRPELRRGAENAEDIRLADERPELYIEPRGHGIRSRQPGRDRPRAKDVLIYRYAGRADDPDDRSGGRVSYALAPLVTTLWARALTGENKTYAETHDYTELLASLGAAKRAASADGAIADKIGSAFRGSNGGTNMARPPWGWFDGSERDRPLGEWFFDPAGTIKRHFKLGDSFSTSYTHAPALGIMR